MQVHALVRTVVLCVTLPLLSASALALPVVRAPQRSDAPATLLFGDDFAGRSLDAAKWTSGYPWCDPSQACPTGGGYDWETYEAGQIAVHNALALVATYNGTTYPSGMITTGGSWSPYRAPTFAFRYGYAEMRAVFPPGLHAWPAFWLLATAHNDPHEIDIVEGQGAIPSRDYMTVHYPQPGGGNGSDQGTYDNPQSLQGEPHTYAVDWQPNAITWYLDGVARFRDTDTAHIPHQLMYVLVDFAVGGWVQQWNGIPGPGDVFPATMRVGYVRVWNHKP